MDIIQLYDSSFVKFVELNLANQILGDTAPVFWVGPKRVLAEVMAEQSENKRIEPPRIAVTKIMEDPAPERQMVVPIRNMGYSDEGRNFVFTAPAPVPVNMSYQLDFYSGEVWQANRFKIAMFKLFRRQVRHLSVNFEIDTLESGRLSIWKKKIVPLILDGGFSDNSDLEPGEEQREIRHSCTVRCEAWIFDEPIQAKTAKSFRFGIYDLEQDILLDTLDQVIQATV